MIWRFVPCLGSFGILVRKYHVRELWYNGMEVCTMLWEFWYNGMEVCTMLGEFWYKYGGVYHVRGGLVQW